MLQYRCLRGSPVHSAITGSNPKKVLSTLLEFSSEVEDHRLVDRKDLNGISPLFLSAFTENIQLVEFLLKHNANYAAATSNDESVLHLCSSRNLHKIAHLVLEHLGAKIEFDGFEFINRGEKQKNGKAKVSIEVLAAIFEPNEDGNTPLHIACDYDHLKLVKLFSCIGERELIDCQNKESQTPYQIAVKS